MSIRDELRAKAEKVHSERRIKEYEKSKRLKATEEARAKELSKEILSKILKKIDMIAAKGGFFHAVVLNERNKSNSRIRVAAYEIVMKELDKEPYSLEIRYRIEQKHKRNSSDSDCIHTEHTWNIRW